jgi:ABC-2 type transport system permease protein
VEELHGVPWKGGNDVKTGNLLGSLAGRKVRFGGYATLLIVAALAVVIAVNVLVDQIPGRLDLTQNKIFSLSPETYKVLDGLNADITITTIGKPGAEDQTIHQVLLKYAARNRHVKLQTIDPELKPGWTKQYDPTGQGLGQGTLIVATPAKYKNIGVYDMYNYDTSNYDPSNPNSQPQLTSLSVEQRVTSALMFVTAEKNTTLGVLEGHGEQTLSGLSLTTSISNENYAESQVSFVSDAAVPAGTDVLLILAPKTDLTAADADKVRAYLAGGGKAMVLLDVLTKENQLPNLAGVLQTYGVEIRNIVVIEGDQTRVAAQNPFYVMPNLEYHDILSPLRANNYPVVLPGAQVVQTLDLKKKTLKIEPLLTSSATSWGRPDITKNQNPARASGDLKGPFNLAVAITDPAPDPSKDDTRLVVAGNVGFLSPSISSVVAGNSEFFMNSVGWLKGSKVNITIRAKSLQTLRLTLNNLAALILSGVVVILMPLLVLGGGFFVWARRRHL